MDYFNNRILKNLFIGKLFFAGSLYPQTLVYNLKIRHSFAVTSVLDKKITQSLTLTPIYATLKRHIEGDDDLDTTAKTNVYEERSIGGMIINWQVKSKDGWWYEFTTGLEKEKTSARGTSNFNASRKGLDDIVFVVGYTPYKTQNFQFINHIITGFPTTKKLKLGDTFDPLVGRRFFTLGAGVEGSYKLWSKEKKIIILGIEARLIHAFQRSWYPLLPCGERVHPGNTIDFLLSLQYSVNRHLFDVGYNLTGFANRDVFHIEGIEHIPNLVRNSGFIRYAHSCSKFPLIKTPVTLSLNFSGARITKKLPTLSKIVWVTLSTTF